ncbi:MAG: tripartite tricarboxylate transporter substrate binding protein [Burkholderiales bacterium]
MQVFPAARAVNLIRRGGFAGRLAKPSGTRSRLRIAQQIIGYSRGFKLRNLLGVVIFSAIFAGITGQVAAQDWPRKPIRLLVGIAPGGFPDITARTVATNLSTSLGQSVVVENRPGGGGNIATGALAKAAPDGYTLLLTGGSHTVNATLLPNPGFDYARDFAPVTMLAEATMMLVATASLPVRNLGDIVAMARQKPGGLAIAISAVGTPNHLGAELLAQMTDAEFSFIPYNGIGPAVPDLVQGRVHLTVGSILSVMPLIKAGSVKPIAVLQKVRSPFAPEVPTSAEAALPGYEIGAWLCLLAPAGMPPAITNRLNEEIRKIMALPAVKEQFAKLGAEPRTSSPDELASILKEETARWAKALKAAKIK